MAHLMSIIGATNIKSQSLSNYYHNHSTSQSNQQQQQQLLSPVQSQPTQQVPHQTTITTTTATTTSTSTRSHNHMPIVTSSATRSFCLDSSGGNGSGRNQATTTTTTIYAAPISNLGSGSRYGRIANDNQNNSNGPSTTTATATATTTPSGQIVVDVVSVTVSPPLYHEIPGTVPAYQGRSSGPPPSYDDVINPNAPPPSYQSLFGQVREARKSSSGLMDLLRQLFLILISTLGCTIIIGFIILIPITMIVIGMIYINDCKAENIPVFLVIGGFVWITKNLLNCYNQFKKDTSSSASSSTSSSSSYSSSTRLGTNRSASSANHHHRHLEPYEQFIERGGRSSNEINNNNSTNVINNNRSATIRRSSTSGFPPSALRSFNYESLLNIFLVGWFVASCIIVYRVYEPDYENTVSSRYCNRTVYLYAFWLFSSTFIMFTIFLSCMCCLMLSSVIASHQEDNAS